jgi:hypothetical protein
MVKLILAIIGGLVAAFVLVFATDTLFHTLSPSAKVPADPSDPAAMRDYVANQPLGVLIGLILGWAVAAFVGSAIAARFSGRGERAGWVVMLLFLLATGANFLMVEHPTWMVGVAVVAIIGAGWWGSRTNGAASSTIAPRR